MRHISIVAAFVLAGCATARELPSRTITVCPTLKPYSKEVQAEAARQLPDVRRNQPIIASLIDDYGRLRAQVRACKEGVK